LWGRFNGEGIGLKIRPSPNPAATFPKSIGYLHPLLQHLHYFGKRPSYSEVLSAIGRLEADGLVSTDLLRRCTIAPAYA